MIRGRSATPPARLNGRHGGREQHDQAQDLVCRSWTMYVWAPPDSRSAASASGMMSYGEPRQGSSGCSPKTRPNPSSARPSKAGSPSSTPPTCTPPGASEVVTGHLLKKFFERRDDYVLATKVFFPVRPGPNDTGLSRKHIMAAIDDSLTRLGTDFVDLYQIHRWDDETPIEETMEALHDVVKAGKARYIGASSMHAWQFAKAQHVAESTAGPSLVAMQNHYNLLYREEEREMIPLCLDQGVGLIPWSPLAGACWPAPARISTPPARTATATASASSTAAPATRTSWPRSRRAGRRTGRRPRHAGPGLAAPPAGHGRPDHRRDQGGPHPRRPGAPSASTCRRRSWPPSRSPTSPGLRSSEAGSVSVRASGRHGHRTIGIAVLARRLPLEGRPSWPCLQRPGNPSAWMWLKCVQQPPGGLR